MHPVCANKLLKLLEEPPEKTVFLLVSEAPDMILPTILSRTQRMNVRKIDEASIDRILQSKYSIQPADSLSIAHLEDVERASRRYGTRTAEELSGILPAHDSGELYLQPASTRPYLYDYQRTEFCNPLCSFRQRT